MEEPEEHKRTLVAEWPREMHQTNSPMGQSGWSQLITFPSFRRLINHYTLLGLLGQIFVTGTTGRGKVEWMTEHLIALIAHDLIKGLTSQK